MGLGEEQTQPVLCAHCRLPQVGSASDGDNPLCHPDEGLDCYRAVTVYGHPMPCDRNHHSQHLMNRDHPWAVRKRQS